MSAEKTSGGEFAQLVADHVLGTEAVDERPPVVNLEGVPDEFGNDRAGASPRLDRRALPTLDLLLDLDEEIFVNIGAFFR